MALGDRLGDRLGDILGTIDGTLLDRKLGLELGRADEATVGMRDSTSLGILLGNPLGEVEGASQPGKDIEPSTVATVIVNASSMSVTVGS